MVSGTRPARSKRRRAGPPSASVGRYPRKVGAGGTPRPARPSDLVVVILELVEDQAQIVPPAGRMVRVRGRGPRGAAMSHRGIRSAR